MRQFIDMARAANAVLSPDALAWLQARPDGHEALRSALATNPFMLTAQLLEAHRPARQVAPVRPSQAFTAAVAQAVQAVQVVASPPAAPRPPPMPVLPPAPLGPAASVQVRPTPVLVPPLQGPSRLAAMASIAHGLPQDAPRLGHVVPTIGADAAAPPGLEVLKDITGKSTCTGELGDFTRYFNDRLRMTKRILKQRRDLAGAVDIQDIRWGQTGVIKLIGMVHEVRTTKNGFRIIELEDATGTVPILVRKNDDGRAFEFGDDPERVLQDEVIGVVAKVVAGKDILYLEGLFHPDVEMDKVPNRAPEPALACFISDVHFGAKTFLDPMWDRFVRWLNGQEGSPEARALAKQVKFLVIAGDVVDGVGVYPGQEHELAIPDIEGQYAFCAQQMGRIPDRVRVVMLPGNHDAVRPAEPQPAMAEKHTRGYKSNVTFVGNPSTVNLMGVEVLAYHGVSLIDYVTSLRGLDVHKPIAIMEEILKRRHIAPMYGGHTPVAPEARDYLVIDRVPDIFVTGHLHTCDVGTYKGVTLINAGTWQDQTPYQKTLGIVPEPARVAMVNLQTGARTVMRFDQELSTSAA